MWTRRDFVLLTTAAVATFGFTLAAFWPRIANAVDETPVTADVKVPALNLGNASVTAALDAAHPRTVILTVHNTTAQAATAQFSAGAIVVEPYGMMLRSEPRGQEVWKQEYAVDLQPGQTKSLSVALPPTAFVPAAPKSAPDAAKMPPLMAPGFSYLTLSSKDLSQPQSIQALSLSTGEAEPWVAAAKSAP